jgi:hypothetical protein
VLRTWSLKLAVQRALAALPLGHHLYRPVQLVFGRLRKENPHAYARACRDLVEAAGGLDAVRGIDAVEIGTGWNMNLPLALYLCGSRSCLTLDVNRYTRTGRVLRSFRGVVPGLFEVLGTGVDEEMNRRWMKIAHLEWEELLAETNITYHAPADAARTGLETGSVRLVYSRAVLQHIPPEVLEGIFSEAMRILEPGGMMWHRLGLTDQLSLFDRRLSRIHYLRYSEEDWQKLAGNRYAYCNRWRISDFVGLAERTGFIVEISRARMDPEAVSFARSGGVHPDFARRSDNDLGTVAADLVCRKP